MPKTEKLNTSIESRIFELARYQISAETDNYEFLDKICPKRIYPVKKREIEHQH